MGDNNEDGQKAERLWTEPCRYSLATRTAYIVDGGLHSILTCIILRSANPPVWSGRFLASPAHEQDGII